MYSRRTYGGFQMNQDPIIQELRKIRKDIEEDCQKRGESYLTIYSKFKNNIKTDSLKIQRIFKN